MNEAQIFALSLAERYGIENVLDNHPELANVPDYAPATAVLDLVLKPEEAIDYLQREKQEKRINRRRFGMEPFDKLDTEYDEAIARYQRLL